MYTGLHVNYPLFLSDFNLTLILAADFRKSPQISNFLVTEDMAKLVVAFSHVATTPILVSNSTNVPLADVVSSVE